MKDVDQKGKGLFLSDLAPRLVDGNILYRLAKGAGANQALSPAHALRLGFERPFRRRLGALSRPGFALRRVLRDDRPLFNPRLDLGALKPPITAQVKCGQTGSFDQSIDRHGVAGQVIWALLD